MKTIRIEQGKGGEGGDTEAREFSLSAAKIKKGREGEKKYKKVSLAVVRHVFEYLC